MAAKHSSKPLHGNAANLTGKRFGRLTVTRPSEQKHSRREVFWDCLCDCGNTHVVTTANLNRGGVSSCGCLRDENFTTRTHGKSKTPEYIAWRNLVARCCNPNDSAYHRYGARGILVCDRWRHSFENFLADMGERPSAKHSIDRKKNDEGYSPENCEWSVRKAQCRNRRSNRLLTYDGITLCVSAWAERIGVSHQVIVNRLHSGWSLEKVLNTPTRGHRPYRRI